MSGRFAYQEPETAMQTAQAAERIGRFEAMGLTVCGIAHDFNNLLTVITGITEHLAETLEDGSEQQQLARDGMLAAERGVDLVRRLLSSSRKAARTPETLDCNQVIDEVAMLVRHALPSGVRLTPVEVWRPLNCTADRTDLILALMNLCANARDAMPDGGRLSLTAQYVLLSQRVARPLDLTAGRYVVFEVRDTGCGMSPDVLARAAEAFFTTKAPTGTGLGLSETASFAGESGGALSISSREGEGTIVSLYLPAVGPTPKVCRLGPRS